MEKSLGSDCEVTVEVYSSFEDASVFKDEWDAVVESSESDIFLTYDWCRIWWEYYGLNRHPRILMFRKDNTLIGILPLFTETLWLGPIYLRVGKIMGSDFTLVQFCLPIISEYLSEVLARLLADLTTVKLDVLHIGPIAGKYRGFESWVTELKRQGNDNFYVFPKIRGEHTYFELTKSWDSYVEGLSKNGKKDVKRKYKNFYQYFAATSDEMPYTQLVVRETLDSEFIRFVGMHQQYWQARGVPGHFSEWPNSSKFCRDMLSGQIENGRARFMVCKQGELSLSYEYGYRFGRKHFALWNAHLESDALVPLSVGIISTCELIQSAIAENTEYVDLMRGRFEYKTRLGGKMYPIRALYICRKTPSTVARGLVFRIIARMIHVVYLRFWRKIICRKLKRFSPLCDVWIKTHMFS